MLGAYLIGTMNLSPSISFFTESGVSTPSAVSNSISSEEPESYPVPLSSSLLESTVVQAQQNES